MRARLAVLSVVGMIGVVLPLAFPTAQAEPESISCTADDYVTRTMGTDGAGIPEGAELLLRFVNLSDMHIIDDEASPAMTGNVLEPALEAAIANNSGQRLNEEFTDEVLNAMVETINTCAEKNDLDLMVATGDLTDNATLNEVRRYIDNLDGTSGAPTAFEEHCGYLTHDFQNDPRLGLAEECPAALQPFLEAPTGRQVADSEQETPDTDDPTYQIVASRSVRQVVNTQVAAAQGGSTAVAPGLPDSLRCEAGALPVQAQGKAKGLGNGNGVGPNGDCENERLAVPHYAAFGNHDGYPRGTVTFQQPFQAGSLAFGRYFFESQREWINEFFETREQPGPVGHGFNHVDEERWTDSNDRNDGYYAFDAGDGVRMIVLNTIVDGVRPELHRHGQTHADTQGAVTGNEVTDPRALEMGGVDQEQFAWLTDELASAATAGQPVLVFSHHPDVSFAEYRLGSPPTDEHVPAIEVNNLLGKHPNVVAWIAGHTHRNVIRPCSSTDCAISGDEAEPANGFWRVETASLVDFPQEGRIVEVYRLPDDGGFALKLTMIRPDPADPIAQTSRQLSEAEDACTTSAALANLENALITGNWCHGESSAAGDSDDRDSILLP